MKKNFLLLALSFVLACTLTACSGIPGGALKIKDAKIALALDEKLQPQQVGNVFAKGTSKVYFWFQWTNAKPKTTVLAKWYYVTSNVHILDSAFLIPLKEGHGSVSLAMPQGKAFPPGQYRCDLTTGKTTIKSLSFSVSGN